VERPSTGARASLMRKRGAEVATTQMGRMGAEAPSIRLSPDTIQR
ncbi:MAG: hypothetical protein QOJ10_170, partial [Chloroflexota bacterium]|nr:hypothetical protein [Chloroflexota bacterium]